MNPVGTLTVPGYPVATITMDGVWHCDDDHEWEDVLNDAFGPQAKIEGPSVMPRAARALWTAAAQTPGAVVKMLHEFDQLPPGAIS